MVECENLSLGRGANLVTIQMKSVVLEPTKPKDMAQHFVGRDPVVREVYDEIVSAARKFGPFEEDPKKTSIHLNRRSAFAGIQTRQEFLILTVKSSVEIVSGRISKGEQVSANRWHFEIRLRHAAEVDSEIANWLEIGYDLSA